MITLIHLINSINNALILKKADVVLTKFNSMCLEILMVLQRLNIIESFLLNDTFTKCHIYFHNKKSYNYFTKIICVSKPSRYIYYNINDLIKLRSIDTYNNYILSINDKMHTIVDIDEAINLHKGGLLLLKIIKN